MDFRFRIHVHKYKQKTVYYAEKKSDHSTQQYFPKI